MKYDVHFATRQTPQTEAIPGKPMLPNSAGGFAFAVDDWARLERFLILGNEGGTYYATEKALTIENAQCVLRCALADGKRTVAKIVEISEAGRAPKNDPAIFALAICAGQKIHEVLGAIGKICRTGTMFFSFVEAVEKFRGHGRALNRALKAFYLDKDVELLAYGLVKYQSRNGWSHRDVLRLCKPKCDGARSMALRWSVGKPVSPDELLASKLDIIYAFESAKAATDKYEICRLIGQFNMPREAIPTQFLNEPEVWEALLEKMPMHAMVRNLATMTRVGLLKPMSMAVGKVLKSLNDSDRLRKSRLHPVAILSAMLTYRQGRGVKSQHTWEPVGQIVDALDGAFYKAFENVDPTGKRWLLGLDISGSMDIGDVAGVPGLNPRMGSAAMALVTAATEAQHAFMAFTTTPTPVAISPRQRLDDVCNQLKRLNMGRTDCAQPMLYAMERKIPVDVFVIYTDNETYAGGVHPCQALVRYREQMGIGAKLIVVGMTATEFSIADSSDGGMMDVVGFDTSAPAVMADFVR